MAITPAGMVLVAIALGYTLSPSESPDVGHRVESDSYTAPTVIARCITYNINKKKPDLVVRNRPSDNSDSSVYLILSKMEQIPTTYGVVRIDEKEYGSHLTTWLPRKSLADASPTEVAKKLIAGC